MRPRSDLPQHRRDDHLNCWAATLHLERFEQPGTRAPVLSRFAHVAYNYCRVREVSGDFKRAAERFDVAAQVAHMHVSTLFKLRYGRLPHRERFSHLLLREGARLAELFERHYLTQRGGLRRYTRPALGCEILGQLVKGLMSSHGINPSFLISSM
jgi:hypothetical protein